MIFTKFDDNKLHFRTIFFCGEELGIARLRYAAFRDAIRISQGYQKRRISQGPYSRTNSDFLSKLIICFFGRNGGEGREGKRGHEMIGPMMRGRGGGVRKK